MYPNNNNMQQPGYHGGQPQQRQHHHQQFAGGQQGRGGGGYHGGVGATTQQQQYGGPVAGGGMMVQGGPPPVAGGPMTGPPGGQPYPGGGGVGGGYGQPAQPLPQAAAQVMGSVAPGSMPQQQPQQYQQQQAPYPTTTTYSQPQPPQPRPGQTPGSVADIAMACANGAAPTPIVGVTPVSHFRAQEGPSLHGSVMCEPHPILGTLNNNGSLEEYVKVLQEIQEAAPVIVYTCETRGNEATGDFRYTNWSNVTTNPTLEQLRQMCGDAHWVQFVPKITIQFGNGLVKHAYQQQQKEFKDVNSRGGNTLLAIKELIGLTLPARGKLTALDVLASGWIPVHTDTHHNFPTPSNCKIMTRNVLVTVEIEFVKQIDTMAVVAHA